MATNGIFVVVSSASERLVDGEHILGRSSAHEEFRNLKVAIVRCNHQSHEDIGTLHIRVRSSAHETLAPHDRNDSLQAAVPREASGQAAVRRTHTHTDTHTHTLLVLVVLGTPCRRKRQYPGE